MTFKAKNYLVILILVVITIANAQIKDQSPYSSIGLGQRSILGFGANYGIGNTGIGLQNKKQINNINPASYACIDSNDFIANFGFNIRKNEFEAGDVTVKNTSLDFTNFAVLFPIIKNWSMSFGFLPYSTMNYCLTEEGTEEGISIKRYLKGNGATNEFFWGNGVKIKNFNIGFNTSFIWGKYEHEQIMDLEDNSTSIFDNKIGVNFDFYTLLFKMGVQYKYNIDKNKYFIFGAILQNGVKTDINFNKGIYRGNYISTSKTFSIVDTCEKNYIDTTKSIKFPINFGFGLSYNIENKLIVAFDYTFTDKADFVDIMNDESHLDRAGHKFNFGIEYTPETYSRNYFSLMSYRLGASYEMIGYKLALYDKITKLKNGETGINHYSLMAGFGFPIMGGSMINLTFEYGYKGLENNSYVKQKYYGINLGFNYSSKWFIKRKYN